MTKIGKNQAYNSKQGEGKDRYNHGVPLYKEGSIYNPQLKYCQICAKQERTRRQRIYQKVHKDREAITFDKTAYLPLETITADAMSCRKWLELTNQTIIKK